MNKLEVQFCNTRFKNPVIAASATPTRDYERMKKCVEAGVGGFVAKTPSFHETERLYCSPRFYVMYPDQAKSGGFYSLYSSEQLSEFTPEEYLEHVKRVRSIAEDTDCRVIVSIMGGNLDEWKRFTEMYAPHGDMVEINLACPYGEELCGMKGSALGQHCDMIVDILRAVKGLTDKPIIAKLSVEGGDLVPVAKALESAGVDAVHLTHRFSGLEIDVDTAAPILNGTLSGYGGTWMGPISRKWVANVARATNLQICGGGGIDGWRDAVAHMMAGATTIQMCAAPMVRGYRAFTQTIRGMERFLDEHGYASIGDVIGTALKNLKHMREVPRKDVFKGIAGVDTDKCNGCGQCEAVCFHGAITVESKQARVNQDCCDGCGLCTQMCPEGALELYRDGEIVATRWNGARGRSRAIS